MQPVPRSSLRKLKRSGRSRRDTPGRYEIAMEVADARAAGNTNTKILDTSDIGQDDDGNEEWMEGCMPFASSSLIAACDLSGSFAYTTQAGRSIRVSASDACSVQRTLYPESRGTMNTLHCLATQTQQNLLAAGEAGPYAGIHVWKVGGAGLQYETNATTTLYPAQFMDDGMNDSSSRNVCIDALAFPSTTCGSGGNTILASSVTFTSTGNSSEKNVLLLWNHADGGPPLCSVVLSAPILSLGFLSQPLSSPSSSSSLKLFSASARQLKSWTLDSCTCTAEGDGGSEQLTLDGRAVSACSGNENASFVAMETVGYATFALMRDGKLCAFETTEDAGHVGRGGGARSGINGTGTILKLWVDASGGNNAIATCLCAARSSHVVSSATAIASTRVSSLIAVGNDAGHVHVFDGPTLNHYVSLPRGNCAVRSCAFSREGRALLVRYTDGSIRCYTLVAGEHCMPVLRFSIPAAVDDDDDAGVRHEYPGRSDTTTSSPIFSPRLLPSWARGSTLKDSTGDPENNDENDEARPTCKRDQLNDLEPSSASGISDAQGEHQESVDAKKKSALVAQLHKIKETSWAKRLSSYRLFTDSTNAQDDAVGEEGHESAPMSTVAATSEQHEASEQTISQHEEITVRLSVEWSNIVSTTTTNGKSDSTCESTCVKDTVSLDIEDISLDLGESDDVASDTTCDAAVGNGDAAIGHEDILLNIGSDDGQSPPHDSLVEGHILPALSETNDCIVQEQLSKTTAAHAQEEMQEVLDEEDYVHVMDAPIEPDDEVIYGPSPRLPVDHGTNDISIRDDAPEASAVVTGSTSACEEERLACDECRLCDHDMESEENESTVDTNSSSPVPSGKLVSRSLVDEYTSLRKLFVDIPGGDERTHNRGGGEASTSSIEEPQDHDEKSNEDAVLVEVEETHEATSVTSSRGFGWNLSSTIPLVRRSMQSLFGSVDKSVHTKSPDIPKDATSPSSSDSHEQKPARCGWARASISGTLRRLRDRLSGNKGNHRQEEQRQVPVNSAPTTRTEDIDIDIDIDKGNVATTAVGEDGTDLSMMSPKVAESTPRLASSETPVDSIDDTDTEVPNLPLGSPPAQAIVAPFVASDSDATTGVVVETLHAPAAQVVTEDESQHVNHATAEEDSDTSALLNDLSQANAFIESAILRVHASAHLQVDDENTTQTISSAAHGGDAMPQQHRTHAAILQAVLRLRLEMQATMAVLVTGGAK